jgi:BarA-like signal transduction histidine kinase
MNMQVTITILMVMTASSFILSAQYPQFSHAILYENGTCTNQNLTMSAKTVINTNGTVDDFLKSLPSDNTILAELVCQNTSDETILK